MEAPLSERSVRFYDMEHFRLKRKDAVRKKGTAAPEDRNGKVPKPDKLSASGLLGVY